MELLFSKDFQMGQFFGNIAAGLAPVFSWHNSLESVFLSPLISLPTFALALIGLFSTTKGFFASRNSIASILIVFCLIITVSYDKINIDTEKDFELFFNNLKEIAANENSEKTGSSSG